MAKDGLPNIETVDAAGITVGVVTSMWNEQICEQLHTRALETARICGAKVTEARVPGALELPVVAQALARKCDAVVVLGCVVRGGTPHFEYVCESVTAGVTRIALDESTPIANGVLTTNDEQQAYDRAGFAESVEDKGAEAMIAALHTAVTLKRLR
ncbi:MAG: 6,7-dimethyl-8-ribityllumazine synthase [Corynebacterium sp.]|nr:6,7-dimethyl-8-ribityllumazine synthase [Corynebacterium sp.]